MKNIRNLDIEEINKLLSNKKYLKVKEQLDKLHPADIAILIEKFSTEQQVFLLYILKNNISSSVLLELNESDRKIILKYLSSKEIARKIIEEIDSDDAADIISELSQEKKNEVIAYLKNKEHAKSIIDLLKYDKYCAGGLMAKELIKVYSDFSIFKAVREMRRQAKSMKEVYSIYVVNRNEKLLGLLSLKKLLTTSSDSKVSEIFTPEIYSVNVNSDLEIVANLMQKYDLIELPVIDELGILIGRITIDDVIDRIKEEADKDFQLASGISSDVDSQDSILNILKARLPWLLIGMFGGLMGSQIIQSNESALKNFPILIFFTPLIAATAGNVGVQASAIMVQGLANETIKGSIFINISKEVLIALLSGLILSIIIMMYNLFFNHTKFFISFSISISLLIVIIFSASIGTFIPLMLNKLNINPAVATGPFITTSNDIIGILFYFKITKFILE